MATVPLFVADLDTLKAKLRLSGVAAPSGAEEIINEAILTVRAGFYRDLGKSRIDTLLAISFTETPETNDEILRATASLTEVKWVRSELIRTLPMLFMDGNAQQAQIYHDEAAFRDASQRQLDAERERLLADVRDNLDVLSGDESIGSEVRRIRIGTVEPDYAPPRPGDTIQPYYTRTWRGGNC